MSNVFASGFGNLGANAVAKASDQANKYNQELTKREMVSQTEESLGGMKLFTSGRELFGKTLKDSKIKQYASQQFKKALKKAGGGDDTDAVQTAASKEAASATKTAATKSASAESEIQETAFGNNAAGASDSQNVEEAAAIKERARLKANEGEDDEGSGEGGGGKGKGEDDDEEDGADLADAGEGAEIGGLEAASSVLDAIPGVDLIGAVLGAVGLVAGFTKKPPHQITNPISNTSYSTQLGLDA